MYRGGIDSKTSLRRLKNEFHQLRIYVEVIKEARGTKRTGEGGRNKFKKKQKQIVKRYMCRAVRRLFNLLQLIFLCRDLLCLSSVLALFLSINFSLFPTSPLSSLHFYSLAYLRYAESCVRVDSNIFLHCFISTKKSRTTKQIIDIKRKRDERE